MELSNPGEWRRQHDQTSATIWRATLALILFSFFCILTLAAQDISLISSDALIRLPFANTGVAFVHFLLIGPVVLLSLTAYLHLFIRYWLELQPPDGHGNPLPYVFNLPYPNARWFSFLVFYWLVPLVLAAFAYKSSPRPEGNFLAAGTFVVTLWLSWLSLRHTEEDRPRRRLTIVGAVGAALLGFVGLVSVVIGMNPFSRSLNLYTAALAGKDLRDAILRDADLRNADLEQANLSNADLRGANLSDAQLRNATLNGANLSKAVLKGAQLTMAFLQKANLAGSELRGASLEGANFTEADLTEADLREANLTGSDFSGTSFVMKFRGADLRGADLTDAEVRRANFCGARNLACDQLKRARHWQDSYRDKACDAPIPKGSDGGGPVDPCRDANIDD